MQLRRIPRFLMLALQRGFIRGRCEICDAPTAFVLKGAWIRGDLLCVRCSSRPRMRALMAVLNEQFPSWRQGKVHESSPGTAMLEKFRKECPGYVASHFYPELPVGAEKNGFVCQDLEKQSFATGSFDLVITQDVLEHVLEPQLALREIARTLKPGGAHVFTVPWYYWQATVVRARRTPTGDIDHVLPADYHGNPIQENARSLVVTEWGRDLLTVIDGCSGVTTEVYRLDDAERGITGAFVDVFVSRKPA
jgi:SAM-dependent methyltransferase